MTYMNYINENIKTIEENDVVRIIICKQDNDYVIKYCSDDRIKRENAHNLIKQKKLIFNRDKFK